MQQAAPLQVPLLTSTPELQPQCPLCGALAGSRLSASQDMPAAEPEAEPDGQPAAAVTPAAEHGDLAEIAPPADLANLLGSSSFWKLQQAPQSPFEELQGYRAQPGAAVGGPDKP